MKVFDKIFSFIGSPSKAFDNEKKTNLSEAFKFLFLGTLILAIITAIIGAIVVAFASAFLSLVIPVNLGPLASLLGGAIVGVIFVVVLAVGIIGSVIWGLWLHLWAYIFGARGGLSQTLKSVFYGMSPSYILGWIPFVNIIIGIWAIVLEGIGLTRLHGISGGKAVGAIILAIVIPLIILYFAFITIATVTYFSIFNPVVYP